MSANPVTLLLGWQPRGATSTQWNRMAESLRSSLPKALPLPSGLVAKLEHYLCGSLLEERWKTAGRASDAPSNRKRFDAGNPGHSRRTRRRPPVSTDLAAMLTEAMYARLCGNLHGHFASRPRCSTPSADPATSVTIVRLAKFRSSRPTSEQTVNAAWAGSDVAFTVLRVAEDAPSVAGRTLLVDLDAAVAPSRQSCIAGEWIVPERATQPTEHGMNRADPLQFPDNCRRKSFAAGPSSSG